MADNMPLVARIMVDHGGDIPTGPGAGAGAGDDAQTKEQKNTTRGIRDLGKKTQGHIAKTLGIQIGIASILKQSQVFTGYIGTIFQLMGALLDVILAPFLPIMIPAIKLLASFVPISRDLMKAISERIRGLWETVKNVIGSVLGFMNIELKALSPKFIKGIKTVIAALLIGAFFARLFGMWKFFFQMGKSSTSIIISLLRIIVANTSAGLGLQRTQGKTSAAALSATSKFRAASLMQYVLIGGLLTALGGIFQRGMQSQNDLLRSQGSSNANAWTSMDTVLRDNDAKQENRNTGLIEEVAAVGLTGHLASRWLGGKLGFLQRAGKIGWSRLAGIGMKQRRDALGRFGANKGLLQRGFMRVQKETGKLGKTLSRLIPGALKSVGNFFKNSVKSIGSGIAKIPGIRQAGNLIKGARFIPGVGAAIEGVIGAAKTYQSFRDHGWKAGVARGAFTLSAMGASLVDPTGIASGLYGIGGHMGLDALEDAGKLGGTGHVVVNHKTDVEVNTTDPTTGEKTPVSYFHPSHQTETQRDDTEKIKVNAHPVHPMFNPY